MSERPNRWMRQDYRHRARAFRGVEGFKFKTEVNPAPSNALNSIATDTHFEQARARSRLAYNHTNSANDQFKLTHARVTSARPRNGLTRARNAVAHSFACQTHARNELTHPRNGVEHARNALTHARNWTDPSPFSTGTRPN
jgi:hypothetical protein